MNNLIMISNSISIDGVPDKIKLLPLGMVKSQKGDFLVDMESFELIKRAFKDRKIDVVVDYEHQTLENVEAPAAGWVKDLDISTDGIYGQVEWSDKALMYLKNKEYRYLSPVIYVRKDDKKAAQLHSVALTNTPAIDGMTPIINSLNGNEEDSIEDNELGTTLLKLLGLPEDSTKEDIIKAVTSLVEKKQDLELEANSIKVEHLKQEVNKAINTAMQQGNGMSTGRSC
jgi:phage I-like protein